MTSDLLPSKGRLTDLNSEACANFSKVTYITCFQTTRMGEGIFSLCELLFQETSKAVL
jgi:hypothetical protein